MATLNYVTLKVPEILFKHVEVNSRLFTDSASCYFGLSSYYLHESVNHRGGEYVRGDVSTNGIEGFWNRLKQSVRGVHGGVSELHLQSYCDEIVYRFNNRHLTPEERFNDLMKRACSVIAPYKKIIKDVKNSTKRYSKQTMYNVVDTETGQIYKTARHAAIEFGINWTTLTQMLKGRYPNKTTLKRVEP